jgi:hypothetical protein
MAQFTQTLGFPEVLSRRDESDRPTLTYFQAGAARSSSSPASGSPRPGSHFGVHVDDVAAVAAHCGERGQSARPGRSAAALTVSITDPAATGWRSANCHAPVESDGRLEIAWQGSDRPPSA